MEKGSGDSLSIYIVPHSEEEHLVYPLKKDLTR